MWLIILKWALDLIAGRINRQVNQDRKLEIIIAICPDCGKTEIEGDGATVVKCAC